ALELREVLGRVIADLAEPAAVEKADHGHVLREVENARRARARLEAEADLRIRVPRDRPHDRRLAGLHLAEQPDNRRLLSREPADPALLLRIRLGSQNDPTNSAPRAGQAFARQDGHASGPSSAACVMPTLFTAPILPVRIRTQKR